MDKIIKIEYCTAWGYLKKAVALTNELLSEYKNKINKLELIPSSGGVYEISLGDETIFSKKELDRYPEEGEIKELLKNKL